MLGGTGMREHYSQMRQNGDSGGWSHEGPSSDTFGQQTQTSDQAQDRHLWHDETQVRRSRARGDLSSPSSDIYRPRSSDVYADPLPADRKRKRDYASSPTNGMRTKAPHSPVAMRHAFRRERRDSSPSYSRVDDIPTRATSRSRSRDRFHYDRQVPSARRTSAQDVQRSLPAAPDLRRPMRGGQRLFGNLSWTKQPSPPPAALGPPSTLNEVSAKLPHVPKSSLMPTVEVNGIKGVPVGPAGMARPTPLLEVKRSPHLFISADDVPALVTTKPHIAKIVSRFNAGEIFMDDTGYFITFPNTKEGMSDMRLCANNHGRTTTMLFGVHPLRMELVGQDVSNQEVGSVDGISSCTVASGTHGHDELAEPLDNEVATQKCSANVSERKSDYLQSTVDGSDPRAPQMQLSSSDQAQPPADVPALELNGCSWLIPLKTPAGPSLRIDKDDTMSSVSGRTSDLSGASGSTSRPCHVCKQRSSSDALIRCNSCPRRYHSHCHPSPNPSVALIASGTRWQCQRCTKKGVKLKPVRPSVQRALDITNTAPLDFTNRTSRSQKRQSSDRENQQDSARADLRQPQQACQEKNARGEMETTQSDNADLVDIEVKDVAERDRETATSLSKTQLNDGCKLNLQALQLSQGGVVVSDNEPRQEIPTSGGEVRESIHNEPGHENPVEMANAKQQVPQQADKTDQHLMEDLVEKSFAQQSEVDPSHQRGAQKKGNRLKYLKRKLATDEPTSLEICANMEHTTPSDEAVIAPTPKALQTQEKGMEERRDPSTASRVTQVTSSIREFAGNEGDMSVRHQQEEARDLRDDSSKGSVAIDLPGEFASASPADSVLQQARVKYTKPTKTDLIPCQACGGRRIPRNPMGKSLCTRCKREGKIALKESSAVVVAKSTATPEEHANGDESTGVPMVTVQKPSNLPAQSPGKQNNAATFQRSLSNINANSKSDMACHDCKRRHIKCSHRHLDSSSGSADQSRVRPGLDEVEDSAHAMDHLLPPASQYDVAQSPAFEEQVPSVTNTEPALSTLPANNQKYRDTYDAGNSNDTPKKVKRQSQRSAPVDDDDLGDSFRRPKGTYWRLYAMALCAALNNRVQAASVPSWVANNIPGYEIGTGSWANGLVSTMILNANGKSGKILSQRVKWKEGDGGESKGDWFELLPGLYDDLQHWDPELQRPVHPDNSSERHRPNNVNHDIDTRGVAQAVRAPRLGHTPETLMKEEVSQGSEDADIVDVDDARAVRSAATTVISEEDSMEITQRQALSNIVSASTTATGPNPGSKRPRAALNRHSSQDTTASLSRLVPILGDEPHDVHVSDEARLRYLLREDHETGDTSAHSLLRAWPDFHPRNRFSTEEKMEEINLRKSRKATFGWPPAYSRLKDTTRVDLKVPPLLSHLNLKTTPRHLQDQSVLDNGTFMEVPCDTLEEFLLPGISDELVPVIREDQLVFRPNNERKRDVYKTGI